MGLSGALIPDTAPKPTAKLNERPVVGALFLEKDAAGAVSQAYKMIEGIDRAKATFDKMVREGRAADAEKFMERYVDDLARAEAAASVKSELGKLTKLEQVVRTAQDMSADEKRQTLDELRKAKIEFSKMAMEALKA